MAHHPESLGRFQSQGPVTFHFEIKDFCSIAAGVKTLLRPSATEYWMRFSRVLTALVQLPKASLIIWEFSYFMPLTVEWGQERFLDLEVSYKCVSVSAWWCVGGLGCRWIPPPSTYSCVEITQKPFPNSSKPFLLENWRDRKNIPGNMDCFKYIES